MTDFSIETMLRNLEYFQDKLIRNQSETARKNVDILEDAILVYYLSLRPRHKALRLLRFGFSKEFIIGIITDKYKQYNQIPNSLLVQINTRELLDGMDRRRP